MVSKITWIVFVCCVVVAGVARNASAQPAICTGQVAAMTQYGNSTITALEMVTINANYGYMSSSTGSLSYDPNTGWISGQVRQIFSDRNTGAPTYQPYNLAAADSLMIWIRPSDGHLWINNLTWGGWQDFAPTCNVSGMFTFTTSGTIYAVSFYSYFLG